MTIRWARETLRVTRRVRDALHKDSADFKTGIKSLLTVEISKINKSKWHVHIGSFFQDVFLVD